MSPATTTIPTANMKDVPGKELKIAILALICPSSVYHACFNPHPTPWIFKHTGNTRPSRTCVIQEY